MRSIIILAGILACASAQAAEDGGGGGRSAQAAQRGPTCMVMHPAIKIDPDRRKELDAWYADCLARHAGKAEQWSFTLIFCRAPAGKCLEGHPNYQETGLYSDIYATEQDCEEAAIEAAMIRGAGGMRCEAKK